MKQYTPVTPEEAVSFIKSNDNIFIHSAAASPQILGKALAERHPSLRNVTYLPNSYGRSCSLC